MKTPDTILKIAVPTPLYRSFDYLAPREATVKLEAGMRLRIPFGRRHLIGVLLDVASHSDLPREKLKAALELLDNEALLPPDLMKLARWAASYYQHPIGEVIQQFIPPGLRRGDVSNDNILIGWRLTQHGRALTGDMFARAPRQRELIERLKTQSHVLREALPTPFAQWRAAIAALSEKGVIEQHNIETQCEQPRLDIPSLTLSDEQAAAVETICASLNKFSTFLLEGITGSGKTEVYLQCARAALALGQQVLVLVPEIGLTPQFVDRFRQRFGITPVTLHSNLNDGERSRAWLAARRGDAKLILGTRSAIFTPLLKPGLIVVDEEHDGSFKQQDGFRYSARDLAVVRGKALNIPVILGSATPSIESLQNAASNRYRRLSLTRRARGAALPSFELLDIRGQRLKGKLSPHILAMIGEHLDKGGQALVFLNRRGFAPTMLCHDCGWIAQCHRCDVRLTFHRGENMLRCHHCGSEQRTPNQCGACASTSLMPLGLGTERIDETLAAMFPDAEVLRIDRDTTRRRGAMEDLMEKAHSGRHRILVGTQMLAKGHDFPEVTLVAVVDIDQGLFSADFRATERTAQLLLQVAGRAGRADKPGHVVIQTHQPEHPLLRLLLSEGYPAFARAALDERREAGLPPFTAMAIFRAEATQRERPTRFLDDVRCALQLDLAQNPQHPLEIAGPLPAPMEKRAGKFRHQLIIQATQRRVLHHALENAVAQIDTFPSARGVRWSLDVDPIELV